MNRWKKRIMAGRLLLFFALLPLSASAQHALDDFIARAMENAPSLKEYSHLQSINRFQKKIDAAGNSAFRIWLSGDYLFTPYFNNHGDPVTTNPSPEAIGYDINLFDGGLYSAQINLERNLFNGRLLNALDIQNRIQNESLGYSFDLEKHNIRKQVTDQYIRTYQFLLLTRLTREVVANLQKQLALTGDLVGKGYATAQDYLLLKIELTTQSIGMNDARQQYKSNLYQLNAMCGIQDTAIVEIDSVESKMDASSPESNFLRKYDLDSTAAAIQQKLFETRYLPQMKMFFNTGLNAVEMNQIQRKFGLSAGLSLSLPLFDGRQKALTRQQYFFTQKTIREYQHFSEQNIAVQRKDLLSRIQTLEEAVCRLAEQIVDYEKILLLSENQLQEGNCSMIDHLTLLRNFVELRKNKIDMETAYQLEINGYNYWNW